MSFSVAAACSGNGGTGSVTPRPSPTPPSTTTAAIVTGGTSALLGGGGTTTTAIAFPAATTGAGGTLTLTASTQGPVLMQSAHRSPKSMSTVLEYVEVTSTVNATFAGTPSFVYTLPAADVNSAATYTLAVEDSTNLGAGYVTIATGTLNGDTLSFAAGTTPFTIAMSPAFVAFQLTESVPASPSPSPTASSSSSPAPSSSPTALPSGSASPAPTASPTASASPAPTASPTSSPTATPSPTASPSSAAIVLSPNNNSFPNPQFPCPAQDYSAGFTASETGYTGLFTAVSQNTAEATVSPASSSGNFVVTTPSMSPSAAPTSTTVLVSDTLGNTASFRVNFNLICLP